MSSRTLAKHRRRLNFPPPRGGNGGRCALRIAVTDPARTPDPAAAAARLPPGAVVTFRHYDSPDRLRLGLELARVTRRRRQVLLVAGDHRLADRLGAAGLHLPEGLARRGILAPLLLWVHGRKAILTVAAHSPRALARAAALKADAALLSPVFPTRSHPGAATLGALRFSLWAGAARLPVVALGGMTSAAARRLAHAAGIAGVPPAPRLP